MRNVFHDPALQKQFDKDGYVCLPFISPEKVEMLKQAFFDTLPKSGGQLGADDVKNGHTITYDFTFIITNLLLPILFAKKRMVAKCHYIKTGPLLRKRNTRQSLYGVHW